MIVVVGVSHQTAPIEVRERFALPAERVPELLRRIRELPEVGEALLISTCNRVELVATSRSGGDLDAVARVCRAALSSLAPDAPPKALRAQIGGEAVRHLFSVAASLESLVLGEPQILGQVKHAYEIAKSAGTVGAVLHRALSRAIHAAKLVRSRTTIGSGQVSVPSVAVELARRIFGDFYQRTVLLVGSGDMAETVARLLQTSGARIVVVGRTLEKAQALAAAVGGTAAGFAELGASLEQSDIVITSTSAPGYVLERELVAQSRRARRGKSQFFIDLAVPRDVDPAIEKLDGIYLYNIDDFSRLVAETLASRSREAERAQAIIDDEARRFDRWADAEAATPTVVALRGRLRAALKTELERSFSRKLRHLGDGERQALETMIEAAVNRMLHTPTVRLREAAADPGLEGASFAELSAAIERLFALGEELDDDSDSSEDVPPASDPAAAREPALGSLPAAAAGGSPKLGQR